MGVEVEGRVLVGKKPTSPAGERFVVASSFGSVLALVLSTLTSGKVRARALEGVLRLNGDRLMDEDDCLALAARLRHARQDDLRAVGSGFGLSLDEEARMHLEAFAGFLGDCGGFGFEMPDAPRHREEGYCTTCFHALIAQEPEPGGSGLLVLNPHEVVVLMVVAERVGGDAISLPQIDRLKRTGDLVLSATDAASLGKSFRRFARERREGSDWLLNRLSPLFLGVPEDVRNEEVRRVIERIAGFLKTSGGISSVRMPSSESSDG